jgi:FKBP-type peptidyl-prolyl cis-trans isomerase
MHRMHRLSVPVFAVSFAVACQRPAEAPSVAQPSSPTSKPGDDLGPMLPGVERQDVVVGSGPEAKAGDRVSVHYSGFLVDGTPFDSSLERGVPLDFVIGKRQVIEGWDIGVQGMKKGGKRKLKIPPHLGYGSSGAPPKIGPDATLLFDVELVEIHPPGS